jgi:hypothetical protein
MDEATEVREVEDVGTLAGVLGLEFAGLPSGIAYMQKSTNARAALQALVEPTAMFLHRLVVVDIAPKDDLGVLEAKVVDLLVAVTRRARLHEVKYEAVAPR